MMRPRVLPALLAFILLLPAAARAEYLRVELKIFGMD